MSKENSFLFKFRANIKNKNLKLELPFRIHFEELRQRSLHIFIIFTLFSINLLHSVTKSSSLLSLDSFIVIN